MLYTVVPLIIGILGGWLIDEFHIKPSISKKLRERKVMPNPPQPTPPRQGPQTLPKPPQGPQTGPLGPMGPQTNPRR